MHADEYLNFWKNAVVSCFRLVMFVNMKQEPCLKASYLFFHLVTYIILVVAPWLLGY